MTDDGEYGYYLRRHGAEETWMVILGEQVVKAVLEISKKVSLGETSGISRRFLGVPTSLRYTLITQPQLAMRFV